MGRATFVQELYAEFLGTFVLIMFGAGVVAQYVLSGGNNGSYLAINLGWGLGVARLLNPLIPSRIRGLSSLSPYSSAHRESSLFASLT